MTFDQELPNGDRVIIRVDNGRVLVSFCHPWGQGARVAFDQSGGDKFHIAFQAALDEAAHADALP